MKIISNAHTHCNWCDGMNTVDEMVRSALEEGFTDLGMSSHSPAPRDPGCPGISDMAGYLADLKHAQKNYAGRIRLHIGVEQDFVFPVDNREDFDYIVGAVHYLDGPAGELYTVDKSPQESLNARNEMFGGDGLAMARAFYDSVVEDARRYRPDVIAHFDLVTLYNLNGSLFDEESENYRRIALDAMDAVADIIGGYGGILEVNTKAFVFGRRPFPYPAPFLLRRAFERGVRVTPSSDCHQAGMLTAGFDEALAQIRGAGYRSIAMLQDGAFKDFAIAG